MKSAVHKYELPILTECEVKMPINAKPFLAQMQDGKLCVWAHVLTNPDVAQVNKKFLLLKTGQESDIPGCDLNYLGTGVISFGMELGIHVFEVI